MILSRHTRAEASFARQQSRQLRSMEWETRLRPLRPWISDTACAVGIIILCILAFAALDIAASYGQHIGLLAGGE